MQLAKVIFASFGIAMATRLVVLTNIEKPTHASPESNFEPVTINNVPTLPTVIEPEPFAPPVAVEDVNHHMPSPQPVIVSTPSCANGVCSTAPRAIIKRSYAVQRPQRARLFSRLRGRR